MPRKNDNAAEIKGSDLLADFNSEAADAAASTATAATKAGKTPRAQKAEKPVVDALTSVIARQAAAQGRNVKRILGRVDARTKAGQPSEEAINAVFAQLREAVDAAVAAGGYKPAPRKSASTAAAKNAVPASGELEETEVEDDEDEEAEEFGEVEDEDDSDEGDEEDEDESDE